MKYRIQINPNRYLVQEICTEYDTREEAQDILSAMEDKVENSGFCSIDDYLKLTVIGYKSDANDIFGYKAFGWGKEILMNTPIEKVKEKDQTYYKINFFSPVHIFRYMYYKKITSLLTNNDDLWRLEERGKHVPPTENISKLSKNKIFFFAVVDKYGSGVESSIAVFNTFQDAVNFCKFAETFKEVSYINIYQYSRQIKEKEYFFKINEKDYDYMKATLPSKYNLPIYHNIFVK